MRSLLQRRCSPSDVVIMDSGGGKDTSQIPISFSSLLNATIHGMYTGLARCLTVSEWGTTIAADVVQHQLLFVSGLFVAAAHWLCYTARRWTESVS
jgi:hypothetical protein